MRYVIIAITAAVVGVVVLLCYYSSTSSPLLALSMGVGMMVMVRWMTCSVVVVVEP